MGKAKPRRCGEGDLILPFCSADVRSGKALSKREGCCLCRCRCRAVENTFRAGKARISVYCAVLKKEKAKAVASGRKNPRSLHRAGDSWQDLPFPKCYLPRCAGRARRARLSRRALGAGCAARPHRTADDGHRYRIRTGMAAVAAAEAAKVSFVDIHVLSSS